MFCDTIHLFTSYMLQSIQELLCGSRMDRPLWLTLTSEKNDAATKTELTKKLVNDLSHLLATLDTKHTNL